MVRGKCLRFLKEQVSDNKRRGRVLGWKLYGARFAHPPHFASLFDTGGLAYSSVGLSISRQKLCHSEGIRVELSNISRPNNEGFLRKPVLSVAEV